MDALGGDDLYAGVFTHFAWLVAVNVALWIISLLLGKTWPVDFIWSSWPIAHTYILITSEGSSSDSIHKGLILLIVSIWGLRLTANFISRGGIGHEDWRYTDQRNVLGGNFWWGSLFSVFLGQSLFMFAGCLSLYPAIRGNHSLSITGYGVLTTLAGILLERTADRQMDKFVASQRGETTSNKEERHVMRSGLWAISRHPNYLGEFTFWLGLWVFSGADFFSLASAGPILMLGLFLGVSIDLMEQRQLKRRGKAYLDYTHEVPALVPFTKWG
jgi:steroid 5-alpha reductase family enzyme